MSGHVIYACPCLNIKIHLASKYTLRTHAADRQKFKFEQESPPMHGFRFELAMGGILISYNSLIQVQTNDTWTTVGCLHCDTKHVYSMLQAGHSVTPRQSEQWVVIHDRAIFGSDIDDTRMDDAYSEIFDVKLSHRLKATVSLADPAVPKGLEAQHTQLQHVLDSALDKMRLASEVRIEQWRRVEMERLEEQSQRARDESDQLWQKCLQAYEQQLDEPTTPSTHVNAAAAAASTLATPQQQQQQQQQQQPQQHDGAEPQQQQQSLPLPPTGRSPSPSPAKQATPSVSEKHASVRFADHAETFLDRRPTLILEEPTVHPTNSSRDDAKNSPRELPGAAPAASSAATHANVNDDDTNDLFELDEDIQDDNTKYMNEQSEDEEEDEEEKDAEQPDDSQGLLSHSISKYATSMPITISHPGWHQQDQGDGDAAGGGRAGTSPGDDKDELKPPSFLDTDLSYKDRLTSSLFPDYGRRRSIATTTLQQRRYPQLDAWTEQSSLDTRRMSKKE
ncbi:hypothetical protein BC940DRAFT_343211 [Gongronella butleri]|nr:hypothetical protein BC940DRAFT_343211 [Gongronella butleri]